MAFFDRMDRHANRVATMAQTLGLDMVDEALSGHMAPTELRGQVLRCMGCKEGDACDAWLAAHTGGAEAAPSYCRNGALFEQLIANGT